MASMGIAYAGVDGTILEVNPAFASMLGYSADQRHKLIGRTLFSLSTPQDMQVILPRVLFELHASLPRVPSPCCPFQSILHVVRDSTANFSSLVAHYTPSWIYVVMFASVHRRVRRLKYFVYAAVWLGRIHFKQCLGCYRVS